MSVGPCSCNTVFIAASPLDVEKLHKSFYFWIFQIFNRYGLST